MLSCCSSQGCNSQKPELVGCSLHPAWILLLSCAGLQGPLPTDKYVAFLPQDTPNSFGHCSSTGIPEEAFLQRAFLPSHQVYLEAVGKNVTVKTWSFVKKSGFANIAALFPHGSTLSSSSTCHLAAGEITAVKGELWFENWHSQHLDISLLWLPSQGKVDFG